MLLGSQCPYCPAVLQGLTELIKQGTIGKLEIINVEQQPEIAQQLGVRSVPWVRIGPFELEGRQTPAELAQWAERAAEGNGICEYISELINTGGISRVETLINKNPEYFDCLISLFSDVETSLNIRVGIGALMEMFADSPIMHNHINALIDLTGHESAEIRIDACHYLSLTGLDEVIQPIESLLNDADPSVRETAEECLAELRE